MFFNSLSGMPATVSRKKSKRSEKSSMRDLIAATPQFADSQRHVKLVQAFPAVRDLFQEYAAQEHLPGLALGIVVDGELVLGEAFGVRKIETNAPVTLDTVFRIASMSKSFVAMAILRLRDLKKLRLDDPVSQYIPQLKTLIYPTRDSPPITIRHLLTMSPGFPEDNPWGDRQMAISERQFTQWLRAGIPFSNAPNVTFEYSNYAYSILGRIITRVSGMPFQRYITKYIFKPLGMNATTWDMRRVSSERLAHGYRWEDDQFKPEPMLPDGAFAAMAGMFTTVPDFVRYMSFLLDAFPPRDDREKGPVSRATAREMQQFAQFIEFVEEPLSNGEIFKAVRGYGFGLSIFHDAKFGTIVAHGGGLPGFGSYFALLPHHGVGLVALSNRTYSRIGQLFPQALYLLAETGSLSPRAIQPAPVLREAYHVVNRWLESGKDQELIAHAADNFLLDRDLAHHCGELEKIRGELGAFMNFGELEAFNALRGRWQIQAERGAVEVFMTLAPTMPPKIQMLHFTPVRLDRKLPRFARLNLFRI